MSLGVLVAMIGLLVVPLLKPVLAQSDVSDVIWTGYDVTIDVRDDGTLHVTERQVVEFDGYFSNGFANIPLSRVEEIENVNVAVANEADGEPEPLDYLAPRRYDEDAGTFTYSEQSGELAIDYGFESTSSDDKVRLVILEYDVLGGIRVYEDLDPPNQQVWWIAISQEVTSVAPVESASVTLNLPEAVAADQTIAYPEDVRIDGAAYTWEASDLGEGDELNIRLQFPPVTSASEPDWQVRDDRLRQERQEREERSAIAGTIMLVGGPAAAVRGRRLGIPAVVRPGSRSRSRHGCGIHERAAGRSATGCRGYAGR